MNQAAVDLSPLIAQIAMAVKILIHSAISAGMGFLMAQANQAALEHSLMEKPWMNGILKQYKPYVPALVSGGIGWLSTAFGVSSADALVFAGAMTGGTHYVNSSDKLAAVVATFVPPKAEADSSATAKAVEQALVPVAEAAAPPAQAQNQP